MIKIYFGKIGCGKTTFLAREFTRARGKYDMIYSVGCKIKGCKEIPYDSIGLFEPQEDKKTLFLIDEAGIYFDNRDFKNLPKHVASFVAESRHYRCDLIFVSQTVDIDKKIRNRCTEMYLVKKFLWWSTAHIIRYNVTVDEETKDLVEGYEIQKGFLELLNMLTRKSPCIFRPLYYKYFNTYSRDLNFKYKSYEDYERRGQLLSSKH